MLLLISRVLDAPTLDKVRAAARELDWRDGALTAGATAAQVKRNEQADLTSRAGAAVAAALLSPIERHDVVRAAARPKRFSRLILSRMRDGGRYGEHVDNALMGQGAALMRADVSFTLFLSPPNAYAGGELAIDRPGGVETVKGEAGDLVLYPSSSIHSVTPVTQGERLACVGWIESLVRDQTKREILFDLENVRAALRSGDAAGSKTSLTLDKSIANLLRLWSRT